MIRFGRRQSYLAAEAIAGTARTASADMATPNAQAA